MRTDVEVKVPVVPGSCQASDHGVTLDDGDGMSIDRQLMGDGEASHTRAHHDVVGHQLLRTGAGRLGTAATDLMLVIF
jgi:hypothetical protein